MSELLSVLVSETVSELVSVPVSKLVSVLVSDLALVPTSGLVSELLRTMMMLDLRSIANFRSGQRRESKVVRICVDGGNHAVVISEQALDLVDDGFAGDETGLAIFHGTLKPCLNSCVGIAALLEFSVEGIASTVVQLAEGVVLRLEGTLLVVAHYRARFALAAFRFILLVCCGKCAVVRVVPDDVVVIVRKESRDRSQGPGIAGWELRHVWRASSRCRNCCRYWCRNWCRNWCRYRCRNWRRYWCRIWC